MVGNLVTQLPNYRSYVIYMMPTLRVLDYQKVTGKERLEAKKRFESEAGAQVIQEIRDREKAVTGGATNMVGKKRKAGERSSGEDEETARRIAELEVLIDKAQSMDEVQRLQKMVEQIQAASASAAVDV